MTVWRPGAEADAWRARAALAARVREFFAAREVIEVETPLLASGCVVERHIEPLRAGHPTHPGDTSACLMTSPELFMKRLLAAGSGPIFQLCKAFRQGESGRLHNPEFTLLEWYRPGWDMHRLMDEVGDLVRHGLCAPTLREQRLSYRDLFVTRAGLDPLTSSLAQVRDAAVSCGVALAAGSEPATRADWLDLMLTHCILPQLGDSPLLFVHGYPADQAALARLDPQDPAIARRFECYLHGIELANGFDELSAADEQRRRFDAVNAERRADGRPELPVDEGFMAALQAGLPACSGVAVGFDRLLMHVVGCDDIDQVLTFSARRL